MAEPTTDWLNTKQAAARLGITTRTLYKFADEGKIPLYKLGRVFRVKAADVDAFLESTRVEPGTLGHLYPDVKTEIDSIEAERT